MGGNLMSEVVIKACIETLYMSLFSTFFAVILGFIPAVVLTLTASDGLRPNKVIYWILDFIVNVFRSFPFIILIFLFGIPFEPALAGITAKIFMFFLHSFYI